MLVTIFHSQVDSHAGRVAESLSAVLSELSDMIEFGCFTAKEMARRGHCCWMVMDC